MFCLQRQINNIWGLIFTFGFGIDFVKTLKVLYSYNFFLKDQFPKWFGIPERFFLLYKLIYEIGNNLFCLSLLARNLSIYLFYSLVISGELQVTEFPCANLKLTIIKQNLVG